MDFRSECLNGQKKVQKENMDEKWRRRMYACDSRELSTKASAETADPEEAWCIY